jgi:cyclophilin family peptidyl-prolyl cis-trans isomerase
MGRIGSAGLVFALMVLTLVAVACGSGDDDASGAAGDATATVGQAAAATSQPQVGTGGVMQWSEPPAMQLETGKDYKARLSTSKGEIVVDLDEAGAPLAVNNFVFLADQGYYTNVPFHRIINGFMVQTGDPTGTGRGGPGYRFADEPITSDYLPGTLAMANAGPNTNGSQFFICHVDLSSRLQKNYTIFGQVVEGMEVVDAIATVPVRAGASGELSVPIEPVTLNSVEIFTE